MAFYIRLEKTKEDKHSATYTYHFHVPYETYTSMSGKIRNRLREVHGEMRINKKSGEVQFMALPKEDDKQAYAWRAMLALVKHWKKGELPEKTCWAS